MSKSTCTLPAIRWQLLSTVSAFALLASAYTASEAQAESADGDHPLIWLELGGQMEDVSGQGMPFVPPFLVVNSASSILQSPTPVQVQRPPRLSFGEEGKISFQPEDSDWMFSAAIRVGRASNIRHVHHQTYRTFFVSYVSGVPKTGQNIHYTDDFVDTHVSHQEHHAILDFSVGKDVGLGMFGRDSTSTLSLGVRIAQFSSKETFNVRARPDLEFKYLNIFGQTAKLPHFHTYYATGHASRSFQGLGPSLSWSGSTPFVGNQRDGELTFDWGANAALLFGKQKTRVRHQETGNYASALGNFQTNRTHQVYHYTGEGHTNIRSVAVPNVGGSVGISWRAQNFKVSMGYRADFFFGAMDTGIDVARKSNLTFNGPYASISLGLGD